MKKKFLSCVAALTMAVGLTSTIAYAATGTDDTTGLSVNIETDKDSYINDDTMRLDITIENTSDSDYENVQFKVTVPDGISFPGGLATAGSLDISANSSETMVLTSNALTGFETGKDSDGINIVMLCCICALIGVLAAMFIIFNGKKKKKNSGKGTASTILVLALGAGSLGIIPVEAATTTPDGLTLTVSEKITIENTEYDISVELSATATEETAATNIGIHDPSVFQDPVSGNYYSYGSHIVAGSSDDLVSWNYIAKSSSSYNATNELFSKHYLEEFSEVYDWLGADVKEGIWALDVTYSDKAAEAGNDPYLMYVTVVNGSFKSALCLATSDKPEGPFEYKGMIVCSDYRQSEVEAGHTNLLDVLGVESTADMTEEQKSLYFTADSAAYKASLPDCIDAAPFYDKDGNLYLAYGSFTCKGGLRVLKLDETTGLRSDETYEYKADGSQDPYYGIKIANANGEGPYILRVDTDKSSTGSYYFLFWSQGNLRSTGGYNMRMFRSEYPDHGYVDYAGQNAIDNIDATSLGVRIMDGFQFTNMTYPSTANGGNSAIVTDDGKIFVHYHSKSSSTAAYGANGFIIKSNQMFLNEDGWLVTTPYKYNDETMTVLDKADVVGDYEFIYHRLQYFKDPSNIADNYVSPELVTLNEDGSVSGGYTGKWSLNGNYITVTIADKEYKGVVLEQFDESAARRKTVVFTASGTDNRTVWGSKITASDADRVTSDLNRLVVANTATEDFSLVTKGLMNSDITWSSDNEAIVIDGSTARVIRQASDTTVTLTATATYGSETNTKTFTVKVTAEQFNIPSTVSSSTIDLPKSTAAGKTITWTSSDNSVINPDTGAVTVPASGSKKITLTGAIEGSDRVITADVTVMSMPTKVVYSENYDSLTSIDASSTDGLWYSANAAAAVTLKEDSNGGNYVEFAPGSANSRGAVSKLPTDGKIGGIYVIDFDLALTAGDNQTTEFAVTNENQFYSNGIINDGIESGYLFKISLEASSTTWKINGKEALDVDAGKWIHINALVDTDAETVALTITDGDTELYSGTVTIDDVGALRGFYIRGGRYNSVTAIDNVTVKQN